MNLKTIEIKSVDRSHFETITAICDNTLGKNYVDHSFLSTHRNTKYMLGAFLNKELIGIAINEIATVNDYKNSFLLCESVKFNNFIKHKTTIGKIGIVAIKKEYQTKGIGSLLFSSAATLLQNSTDALFTIHWLNEAYAVNPKYIVNNGFSPLTQIENYWTKDSLGKKYNCPICGTPPCKCSARIFIKE